MKFLKILNKIEATCLKRVHLWLKRFYSLSKLTLETEACRAGNNIPVMTWIKSTSSEVSLLLGWCYLVMLEADPPLGWHITVLLACNGGRSHTEKIHPTGGGWASVLLAYTTCRAAIVRDLFQRGHAGPGGAALNTHADVALGGESCWVNKHEVTSPAPPNPGRILPRIYL